MPRWTFIRHGQSVANKEDWLAGHIDTPLTRLGEQQAAETRFALVHQHVDRVLCSDLTRAQRTAEIVLGGRLVPMSSHEALRERHCGDWAYLKRRELIQDGRLDTLYTWTGKAPNGESLEELMERVLDLLANYDDGTECTWVVAHGMVIRGVMGLLEDGDPDLIGQTVVPNAVPISVDVQQGRFQELLQKVRGDEPAKG